LNDDIFQGQWKQLKGKVKQAWGVLTDDEIDQIGGKRDALVGKLQEKYGWSKMEAENELERFVTDLDRGM
jgi:uncharacterized protein YjbJ (UPF0337 family)